jgi:hypothetical protein
MRRFFLSVLLLSAFCFPSFGQIRFIDENGEVCGVLSPNLGDDIFRHRVIYGRYPKDKKELLDFILDKERYEHIDSADLDYFNTQKKAFAELVKERRNKLIVSGDTCTFYIADSRWTYQCIGGLAELQKEDYRAFQFWNYALSYDRNGKVLWSLVDESPSLPRAVDNLKTRFGYIVTADWDDPILDARVMIPVTMTRDGAFTYDLSCLEGLQLYYQEYGKRTDSTNRIGSITIEEAIDQDYIDTLKAYMTDYLHQHEEVYTMKLWELVLFNNPSESPKEPTSPAPSDSVLVVVDGIVSPVRFKNNAVPPLELALQVCPFLSEGDIDTVQLIKAQEASASIILCYNPGDVLLITTHEECAIHDFFLDGKPVHKKKGIALGSLLDREHLLVDIKKKWGIRPNRIKTLEVEGKTIRITTK